MSPNFLCHTGRMGFLSLDEYFFYSTRCGNSYSQFCFSSPGFSWMPVANCLICACIAVGRKNLFLSFVVCVVTGKWETGTRIFQVPLNRRVVEFKKKYESSN